MTHDWLDQLIGEWTFHSVSVPPDPQYDRTGSETVTRRGAWIVIEPIEDASEADSRFQLAFNPETGKVTGDFVHWAHPTLWTYEGGVEADGRLHLKSRGPSMEVGGQMTDYDDVFEIASPDERRLRSRVVGQDGQMADFMITTYRRKS